MAAQRRRDTRFFFLPGEQGNDVALFASVRNRDGTSRAAAACKSFTRVCVIANELERGYMPCRLDVGRNVFTRGIRSIGTTSILLSAICIYVRIYIYTHKCVDRTCKLDTGRQFRDRVASIKTAPPSKNRRNRGVSMRERE